MAVADFSTCTVAQWVHEIEQLSQTFPMPDLSMLPAEIMNPTKLLFNSFYQAICGGWGGIGVVMANEQALRYQDILQRCFCANGLNAFQRFFELAPSLVMLQPFREGLKNQRPDLHKELEQQTKISEGLCTIAVAGLDVNRSRRLILFFFREDESFLVNEAALVIRTLQWS